MSGWLASSSSFSSSPSTAAAAASDVTAGFVFSSATCVSAEKNIHHFTYLSVGRAPGEVVRAARRGAARDGLSNWRHLYAGVRPIQSDAKRARPASIFCRV